MSESGRLERHMGQREGESDDSARIGRCVEVCATNSERGMTCCEGGVKTSERMRRGATEARR